MKLGMVGLPNVGKSTLFNAITNAGIQSENYPFCTIETNLGIVTVPDSRLDRLVEIYKPDKFTHAVLEFADIAGLVRGASKGEGLGNKFLSNIAQVDAIIHVVRCFDNDDVIHVEGSTNAKRDMEIINLELIFADLECVTRRIEKTQKMLKGNKSLESEIVLFEKLKNHLEDGNSARAFECTDNELEIISTVRLLTLKPVIYAANMSEDDFKNNIENNVYYKEVCTAAQAENAVVLPVCAKLEEEISDMAHDEKELFLSDVGLKSSGLDRIIQKGYSLLKLISFFTAGKPEVRAWTIPENTLAPKAAGKIHTDFERGFIRAEVVAYDDFIACGDSIAAAKEKGLFRLEGKEYIVCDGDIILFRFNV